jgi:hypothetical protein
LLYAFVGVERRERHMTVCGGQVGGGGAISH